MRSLLAASLIGLCLLLLLFFVFGGQGRPGDPRAGSLSQDHTGEARGTKSSTELPGAIAGKQASQGAPRRPAEGEPLPPQRLAVSKVELLDPEGDWSYPLEPDLEIAGDISGQLISEKGYWLPPEIPEPDTLIVELVRLEEPRLELRANLVIEDVESFEGGKALSFLFKDVPEGMYELSLFNLGAWHWEPRTMTVEAPAAGLDFVRLDRDEVLPLSFEVFDALTGDPIEEFSAAHLEQTVSDRSGVFMHAGPIDQDSFPQVSSYDWSVWAQGYRPSFGDENSFELREGRRVARVGLHRGWAARIVVLGREPTMRPLPRATVRVDSHFAGATDANGALIVERDSAPEKIEVEYRDWILENDPLDPRPGTSPQVRGHVLPLILRVPQ